MTGSAAKLCEARRTVAHPFLYEKGGWFGRGVIKKFERAGGGRIFKGGPKRDSFFASIFASILGWIWGHILD